MSQALDLVYCAAVLIAAVGGMAGTMYVTRGPEGDDTRRLGVTTAAVGLFVTALVVSVVFLAVL